MLRPTRLLASLLETFTPELSTGWSPSPLSGMTTVATGQVPPAGLTPARSAASVAAPVPGFRCQFLSDMPSPRTPESSSVDKFQCNDADIGLRRGFNGSALPISPQSISRGGSITGLPRFTHLLRPASLLAPLHGSDQFPSRRGLLLPGFQRDWLAAGYDYSSGWTPLLVGLSPTGMAARLAAPDLLT